MPELIMEDEVYAIIGAAIEVHKQLGHGFLEGVYDECFGHELHDGDIPCLSQPELELCYKHRTLKKKYIPDFVCFGEIIVEIKAIKAIGRTKKRVGLLINFNLKGKLE